ncbi:hypothetical protein TNCV_224741 [Trichonephila clavipes]|nr:hypothetical protein TNCV_224741 [Trichonephila clavipes]
MDKSASRTDVASSIEVSDLFTLEPLSFDVMAATEYIENCTTCTESEDLCGILDEILYTLEDVDSETDITLERLKMVNLVMWTALKCSRRSIRLQNAEFKKYVREVELSKRAPTAASPASQQKRMQAKRQPASPQKDVPSKKQAKSERKLPRTSTSPRHIEDASPMEEGDIGDRARRRKPSRALPKDDGFTTVGRKGKRIAPIVIDAQSNASELLTQLGNLSLQGRFENGKLRVFPTSAEEHRIIQKFVSDKKKCGRTLSRWPTINNLKLY